MINDSSSDHLFPFFYSLLAHLSKPNIKFYEYFIMIEQTTGHVQVQARRAACIGLILYIYFFVNNFPVARKATNIDYVS